MHHPATSSRALFASAAVMAAIVIGATAAACGSDSVTTPITPTFVATLNGAGENPVNTATGTGTAQVVKNGTTYTYTIVYTGLSSAPTGAHIHAPALAGANANVIVPFTIPAGVGASGTLTGTFTSTNNVNISTDSLDKLMTNGNAYVNLHTTAKPGGEIRGQLSRQN
jgi:hypothetical protein